MRGRVLLITLIFVIKMLRVIVPNVPTLQQCLCSVLQKVFALLRRGSKILFAITTCFLMRTRFIVLTGVVLIDFAVTTLLS
jgi:hypothetical protein